MNADATFGILLAFSIQGIAITSAALALARLLPIERPALRLGLWQAVLAASLVLPLIGPWTPVAAGRIEIGFGSVAPAPPISALALGRNHGPEVVVALLALGVALRALGLVRGAARLRSCRRRAVPYDSQAIAGLEETIGARADVRSSPEVSVPATFGLRRPMVLLPTHVQGMEPERQRAIVAHELVHVRRRDWPVAVAEEVLATALWFHPAVRIALGRIRLAREQCVDAAVIEAIGGRQAYLESLLEVAAQRRWPELAPAALFLGERHLSERVELLLKEVVMSKVRALIHLSVSAIFVMLAGAVASSSFPLPTGAEVAKESKPTEKAKVGEPRLVHKVSPVYPPEAKKDRIEGAVHIDVRLAKDGTVAEAKAIDGHATLAEAALAAVRQWRYEPVIGPDKKPVEARMTITVNFRLAD